MVSPVWWDRHRPSPAGALLTCSNQPVFLRRRRRACTSDGRAGTRWRRTSLCCWGYPAPEPAPSPRPASPAPQPPRPDPAQGLGLFPAVGDAPVLSPSPDNTSSVMHVLLRAWAPVLHDSRSCQHCRDPASAAGTPPALWGPHQPCGDPSITAGTCRWYPAGLIGTCPWDSVLPSTTSWEVHSETDSTHYFFFCSLVLSSS